MISTFFLKEDNNANILDTSILDIKLISTTNHGDVFENLRSAVEWSIANDEDAIYCVCDNDFRSDFNLDDLNELINDLASEKIYSFYVNANYEGSIPVDTDLRVISNITSVTSFILLSPIYESVLSLLNELVSSEVDFNKFIELFIPNAFLLLKNDISEIKTNKLHIISPFRNVINYIDDYLMSIISQRFINYRIILIDDCSTDGCTKKIPDLPFIKKIINNERKYALQNIVSTLTNEYFEDDDIICLVDADDMLTNKYVLDIINNSYEIKPILMTYGSMSYIGSLMKLGEPYSEKEFKDLREINWKLTHFRTFKYKVFKELLNQDKNLDCLRNSDGEIFKMPYDMAVLFPMMELVGYENIQFINTSTYKYRLHPDNDHHINRDEQYACEIQIRNKPKFNRFFS